MRFDVFTSKALGRKQHHHYNLRVTNTDRCERCAVVNMCTAVAAHSKLVGIRLGTHTQSKVFHSYVLCLSRIFGICFVAHGFLTTATTCGIQGVKKRPTISEERSSRSALLLQSSMCERYVFQSKVATTCLPMRGTHPCVSEELVVCLARSPPIHSTRQSSRVTTTQVFASPPRKT